MKVRCAPFCRDGLLLQRRSVGGNSQEVQTVHMGLATVAMAVAASSAFPGFFPPLELSHKDVGATESEFSQHAFTDGGIYDNLGLRMFRYLQRQTDTAQASNEADRPIASIDLDGVFVSDAGATFKVRSGSSGGGLLLTALRSSDILMDRVNQLELETFAETDKEYDVISDDRIYDLSTTCGDGPRGSAHDTPLGCVPDSDL